MISIKTLLRKIKTIKRWLYISFPQPCELGGYGSNSVIIYPCRIVSPHNVYIEDNARISANACILNAPTEKVIIKRYSVISVNCTIVTNNHKSTVTIPQFLLGASHVNDKSNDVIIDEDVWVGAGVTIMAGVRLGRGCIVGAGSIVNKSVPPYAVVAGSPAKIIKKNFSIDHILQHEAALYPENERFSREYLEENEKTYFDGLKEFGTSDGIDDDALNQINKIKKLFNYIEPIK